MIRSEETFVSLSRARSFIEGFSSRSSTLFRCNFHQYERLISEYTQRVFSQASPEAILYDASAAEKAHQTTSTTRGVVKKLQPFVQAVEQYGPALDVYSNIYPLALAPLWGSVRVVLHVKIPGTPCLTEKVEDKNRL